MRKDLNTVLLEGVVVDMDVIPGEKILFVKSSRYQIIKNTTHESKITAKVKCSIKTKVFIGDTVMISGEIMQEKANGPLYLWAPYVNVTTKLNKAPKRVEE